MGELIRRETAAEPFSASIEHYHRYLLARELCRGKDVLDFASGEGYGSAMLAEVAQSVVGVEPDEATVSAARGEFVKPNLRFEQGNAECMSLPDDAFDVVVSFETMEHFREPNRFVSELRRVLRPGGLLVISTPDRNIYSPLGQSPNFHHIREFNRTEFEAVLRGSFANTMIAAQRAVIGSLIVGPGNAAPVRCYERRGETYFEASDSLPRAPYLLALASDGELPLLPSSVYVHRDDLDTDREMRHTAELGWQMAEGRIVDLSGQLVAAEARITDAQAREAALHENIAALYLERTGLHERLVHFHRQRETAELNLDAQIEKTGRLLRDAQENAHHVLRETERQLHVKIEQLEAHYLEELENHQETERRRAAESASNHSLRVELHDIHISSLWRATRPLRNFSVRYPGATYAMRQMARLIWRTASLQRLRVQPLPAQTDAIVAPQAGVPVLPTVATDGDDIRVAASTNPVVSVIIPACGEIAYTLGCLRSIARYPTRWPIEVIVVDDGSADASPLAAVHGIKIHRNAVAVGRLQSCNAAVDAAKGRYLLLLDHAVEVMQGSIDNMVDLLENRPEIGMAGSKLLFTDGRLQEAGGIVWQDASTWSYGRGDDPSRPEFNYLREVDYCSGISIMLRRTIFERLHGFDQAFAPEYEAIDLAFRIRADGHVVVYEPRSTVSHHEPIFDDIDGASKARRTVNRMTMIERWTPTLTRENHAHSEHLLRARDRARHRKVILVIDRHVPEPDHDATSRSVLGILDSLVDAGWLVKLWPYNRAYSAVYTTALERRGIEVVDDRCPDGLNAWMDTNVAELNHILLVGSDVAMAALPYLLSAGATISYYGVELQSARMRLHSNLDGSEALSLAAERTERLERRLWRQCDAVIYSSQEEVAAVRALEPNVKARAIVPFCFGKFPPRTAPAKARSILFVAGFSHLPNVDAAYFLIRAILPKLEQELGAVTITLAGASPSEAVVGLTSSRVTVTGYVTDETLDELYEQHRVSVVPLRFGAGVTGTVVESLSRGLPVVTTSIGAQGIAGLGDVVPVLDEAEAIAAALSVLLTDDAAWLEQSARQMTFAQERFSRDAMRRSVMAALDDPYVAQHIAQAPTALTLV